MKTKSLLIKPYLLHSKGNDSSKTGFKITNFKSYLLTNKFVKIVVDWDAKDEYAPSVRTATLVYDGTSSDGSAFVHLAFKDGVKLGLEVGIEFGVGLDYIHLFTKNTRYGAVIYFAPFNWEKIKKEIST